MHQLSRWPSKLFNCPEKVHKDVTAAELLTRVVNSSRCVEHIMNPLQHQVKHIKAIQIKGSMKSISESQRMRSGSIKVSDQCLPIGR
jgi:hypothetical protein